MTLASRYGFVLTGFSLMSTLQAGVYSPAERCPFPVRDDGIAEELSFGSRRDGAFPRLFSTLLNQLDANPARADNPDRQRLFDEIARLRAANGTLAPADLAGLGAAYYRAGKHDDATAALGPRVRDRTPDFRILANLAQVYAALGNWDDAYRLHQDAFDLADFPDDLAGATPAQRRWLEHIERTHYRRWLQIHRDRAAAKAAPEDAEVFPLFPARFVSETGGYVPGQLAASEQAKLPADAVAVVQQLLLWSPWDSDLYWLLGELYAADGRLREAEAIFDQCAQGRYFTNRRVFMEHRAAVREAVSRLPPDDEGDAPLVADRRPEFADLLPSVGVMIGAGLGFAALAVSLIALQVRALRRRQR